jgi:hypothetical protein
MFHARPLRTSSSVDSETLSASIARAARGARWRTLIACVVLGGIGVPAGWFVSAHRVLLVSGAIAVGAFGAGGLADRILADERGSADPDPVLVAGFAAIRWLSGVVGTCAAIAWAGWMFFRVMGNSFWN